MFSSVPVAQCPKRTRIQCIDSMKDSIETNGKTQIDTRVGRVGTQTDRQNK